MSRYAVTWVCDDAVLTVTVDEAPNEETAEQQSERILTAVVSEPDAWHCDAVEAFE